VLNSDVTQEAKLVCEGRCRGYTNHAFVEMRHRRAPQGQAPLSIEAASVDLIYACAECKQERIWGTIAAQFAPLGLLTRNRA